MNESRVKGSFPSYRSTIWTSSWDWSYIPDNTNNKDYSYIHIHIHELQIHKLLLLEQLKGNFKPNPFCDLPTHVKTKYLLQV